MDLGEEMGEKGMYEGCQEGISGEAEGEEGGRGERGKDAVAGDGWRGHGIGAWRMFHLCILHIVMSVILMSVILYIMCKGEMGGGRCDG